MSDEIDEDGRGIVLPRRTLAAAKVATRRFSQEMFEHLFVAICHSESVALEEARRARSRLSGAFDRSEAIRDLLRSRASIESVEAVLSQLVLRKVLEIDREAREDPRLAAHRWSTLPDREIERRIKALEYVAGFVRHSGDEALAAKAMESEALARKIDALASIYKMIPSTREPLREKVGYRAPSVGSDFGFYANGLLHELPAGERYALIQRFRREFFGEDVTVKDVGDSIRQRRRRSSSSRSRGS